LGEGAGPTLRLERKVHVEMEGQYPKTNGVSQ